MKLDNKVALITGGSLGLGKSTAFLFAEEGANVIITGRTEKTLKETVAEAKKKGLDIEYLVSDVSSEADCKKAVDYTINKYGKMIRASNPELDKYQILQGYIKYVLESGSSFEKTRLMRNINNKLVVHNRDLLINGSISQGKIEAKKSSLSQLD